MFVPELGEGVHGTRAQCDVCVGVVDVRHEMAERRVADRVTKSVDVQGLPVEVVV